MVQVLVVCNLKAAKLGGMVLCDEATHDATRDEIRFVRLRPVCIKGKSELYRPYRPVASSEILEKPKRRDFLEEEYYPTREAQLVLEVGLGQLEGEESATETHIVIDFSCETLHHSRRENTFRF